MDNAADNRARTFLMAAVFFGAVPVVGLLAIAVTFYKLLAGPGRLSASGRWVVAFGLIAAAGSVLVNVKLAASHLRAASPHLTGFDPALPLRGGDRAQTVVIRRAQAEAGEKLAVATPAGGEVEVRLSAENRAGDYWIFDDAGDPDGRGGRGALFVVLQLRDP